MAVQASLKVREISNSFENIEGRNYNVSTTFTWLLPCNTNGELQRFNWHLVGISTVDSTRDEQEGDVPFGNYSLLISELRPLHLYKFGIMAIVVEGDEEISGEENSLLFESPDGYPTEPTRLRIAEKGSFFTTIVWDRPEHENGEIVLYRLTVTSSGPSYNPPDGCGSIEYETVLYNHTVDPQMRTYTFQVRSNFNYTVVLLAKTRTGEGPANELHFTSQTSAPNTVANIQRNVIDMKSENYSSHVEISFEKTCDLNDNFEHYTVDVNGTRSGYPDDDHNFDLGYNTQSFQLNLKPQYTYSGFIAVVTTSHTSSADIDSFTAPAGVPPSSTKTLEPPELTATTATLVLDNQFFDNSQGDVIYYAIIVNVGAHISEGLGGKFDHWDESVWPDSGFWSPNGYGEYQTTPAFWAPFQDTRSANYTYVIGIGNCSVDNNSYCNGPLRPETQYAVRIRGFTSNAYRDTSVIYFITPSEETYLPLILASEETYLPLILGLVFGILAAIMLLAFIFFLWCRRKKEKVDTPTEETVIQVGKPPPISKHKFVEHCLMFEENRSQLKAEYSHLDRLSASEKPSSNVAMADNNKRKNRYINIMPYDDTRVRLTVDSNDNYEDYINASYIKGYSGNHEYIATQGPMESTVEDFWRMIIQEDVGIIQGPMESTVEDFWRMIIQEDVGIIVMVAQFVEQSKQKCFKYFPEKEEIMSVGDEINVKCTNEINLDDYVSRTLIVEKDGQQMLVKHLQYMLWPDFGCPTNTSSMLEFRESMRKHIETTKNKAVIHCSAGVGRTGTLIAIDILLQKIDNTDDDVDVFTTVLDLRKQRTHMVQTEKQYEFIHKCLRDYLTKPKLNSDENLSPIYENVNIINGYSDIIRTSGSHTSTENLIRLKEL
ncbi:TM proximal of protein tyrosine phosphatase, receptor type J [Popillia japonica]|uniref:protein-tyrosine-phosphatase n=1 Tax=Popillia japonica TaxID=7064 RepID=A0AAW1KNS8_POPJA